MTRAHPFASLLILIAPGILFGQETGPAPLPTGAEVRKQVDDGQFQPALKNLLRILELKGPAAVPYNRAEMLMLRSECLLQTRQGVAAKEALEAGLKESFAQGDSISVGKFLALSALVSRSPNMTFVPKRGNSPVTPKPINILDRAARPDAYKRLFDEMLPVVKTKVKAASQAGSMTIVLAVGRDVATLRGLDKAAAGAAAGATDSEQAQQLAGELLNHADILLSNSLNEMNGTVRAIQNLANQQIIYPVQNMNPVTGLQTVQQVPRRRGMMNGEAGALRSMGQTAGQMISAANELSVELSNPEAFKQIAVGAADLQRQAAAVLNDDYTTLPQ